MSGVRKMTALSRR